MPKIQLLHTGGTLGMKGSPLEPDQFSEALTESVPELAQIADVESTIVCNLDSSDMTPTLWSKLAGAIEEGRETYDGFVIVHGTDTMAFTASALAFALPGLDRPVILTGAQRPLAALRSDARRNLTDAVTLATMPICEVGICFDGLLLRGCTSTKSSVHDYRAFDSPQCPPLARLGVDVGLQDHLHQPAQPFQCLPKFDDHVVVIHAIPGMRSSLLEAALAQEDLRGIVLVAFGLGTIPTKFDPIAPVLQRAIDRGVDVLVVTQSVGAVKLGKYHNSLDLLHMGAIEGGAMTLEAATTKLMHALANFDNPSARRRYLEWNIAGELS